MTKSIIVGRLGNLVTIVGRVNGYPGEACITFALTPKQAASLADELQREADAAESRAHDAVFRQIADLNVENGPTKT